MVPLTGSIVHHASGVREPACAHAYYNHFALKQDEVLSLGTTTGFTLAPRFFRRSA